MKPKKSEPLSEETIQALIKLGEVLRPIRACMVASGNYEIINGKLGIIKK